MPGSRCVVYGCKKEADKNAGEINRFREPTDDFEPP